MYPCSTTISRELQPTTASHSPFSPPLDSQLKHLTGYVRALTGSMEPTGCAGTMLKTTFPVTEYDLMSKFSRSILPSCGGGSCLCWLALSQTISMAGGQRWSKSRLEGRLGSRTSVPTTASSQGAISKCSYCFDIKIYNQNLQATPTPLPPVFHQRQCPSLGVCVDLMKFNIIIQQISKGHSRRMPSSKSRKVGQKQPVHGTEAGTERTLTKIKFNISFDSLRPFVEGQGSARTQRRRPAFSELAPQTLRKNAKQLPPKEEHTQREARSPDVAREVSNQILQKIEAKGIGCAWEQAQQGRVQAREQVRGQGQFEQWQREVWLPSGQMNSSFASTSDLSTYLDYYDYCQRLRQLDPQYYEIDAGRINQDPRTTLMIKNIPNKYTIQLLSEQIDRAHANSYDFLYLPCDIKNNCNVGYGFVNFLDLASLQRFYLQFQGKRWGKFKSEKICTLTYARLQGLHSLIEHFQNSKVLNHKDKKYQPIIREYASIEHLLRKQRALQQIGNERMEKP